MSDKDNPSRETLPLSEDAIDRAKRKLLHGVGYKSPPTATRFKKGQSGNPNGRPRATKAQGLKLEDQPVYQAVLERAAKPVRMREGDMVSEVSTRDAMVQSVYATALKGNARSQGLALDLMRTADMLVAKARAEHEAEGRKMKAFKAQELAAAIAAGRDTRLILPHPDDIVVGGDAGYSIVGPCDEASLLRHEHTLRVIDALILQDVLDRRRAKQATPSPASVNEEITGASLLGHLLNHLLPPRLQIGRATIMRKEMRAEKMTLRHLLKQSYAAWRALNSSAKRGISFPDFDVVKRKVELRIDFHRAYQAGKIDLDALSRGEYSDEVLDIMDRHGITG
jgi:hypothetical protein